MSHVVMRHEMSDMWWITWDREMSWMTWDRDMRWVTWDDWHEMSDMWLADCDPLLSVNSLFWTLWQTLCLTLFLSLEASLSDVMMRDEMSEMRLRLKWVRDILKPYSYNSGQKDAAGWAKSIGEGVGRGHR